MQTYTEDELRLLAHSLYDNYGKNHPKAVIFALEGPLGAGKTTFTKYLAQAAGISDKILSPTFILHREYIGLDHIDAWRMENPGELLNLGIEKMISQNHIIVVEWADKVADIINKFSKQARIIWIKFEPTESINERRISIENLGH
jgi:tRNA threonylcarbamoyladenosine biosynthesis protein TsaE